MEIGCRNIVGKGFKIGVHVLGGLLVAAVISLIFGYFIMLLWNWLMPAMFVGIKSISYWQATGLVILTRLLFGSGHGKWHDHKESQFGCADWRERRYYEAWWKAEGKQAFKAYIDQLKMENQPQERE